MAVLVLIGLPGTGKTALASALAARSPGALVLHTDLLKVTLRAVGAYPPGPIWTGDLSARLAAVRPHLEAQRDKACAEGYDLVIEGTLALALRGSPTVRLDAPDAVRDRRIATKHPSARRALAEADLGALRTALAAAPVDRALDAAAPLGTLVGAVEAIWRRR